MANLIQKTILHPENSKEVDLYPKTSYEQVEGLDGIIAGINNNINNIPIGEKVSFVFPKNAANGNITDEQLAKLQANDANYIEMVNDKELYYLNDSGHEEGFLTYSHVGIENSKATIKTLTITVSAKSFVIVTTVVPTGVASGGKLYKHIITVSGAQVSNKAPYYAGWAIIDNYSKPYTLNEIVVKYYFYNSGIGMPILVYSLDVTHQRFLALLTYERKIVVGMTEESDFGTATNFKDTVTEL